MSPSARHTWVPFVAAIAGAALLLKATLIIGSGNAVPEAPMGVLFLGGLLLAVVAAVGAGLRRERVVARVASAVGGVLLLGVWIAALSDAVEPVVALVSDAQHVLDEAPIGVAGVVLLGLAWWGFSRDTGTRRDSRPAARDAAAATSTSGSAGRD